MSEGWSFGGSILTFAFPMLLFIVVAVALYILYTKPVVVPGHRTSTVEYPVSHTPIPGIPVAGGGVAGGGNDSDPVAADGDKAAEGENAAPEVQQ